MSKELSKTYDPNEFEERMSQRWLSSGATNANPDERGPQQRYVIMMPLPNVTGALHLGHAMDNVMQDMLIRFKRMQGFNALWQPGTDHAGIATQAVVEKRLFELEGKTRHDIGREALVERIWHWKDEYQARIVRQQQAMGCSCDWRRQRFTMDRVCTAAVRECFFRLFKDKLIFRGNRLVNWDCQLQTAISDDEVFHASVDGHFWHLRYPVIDPKPGEPTHITVATTRPETMLGDTAVACHPTPTAALERKIAEQRVKIESVAAKERAAAEAELERLEKRRDTHLAALEQLAGMAKDGRKILLPLLDREMPLIVDVWAKPELGSGCVKVTPAHDPNDYDVWQRHVDEIGLINILEPNGKLNENAGQYAGLDRFDARDRVLADLQAQGLIEQIEDRVVEIGHSDRSKTPVEPYLSQQWFVHMDDVEGGVVCAKQTPNEFVAPGLAQMAIDAAEGNDYFPTSKRLAFFPDRYKGQYVSWLAEKRDWCISRQLWWGHRIPVWAQSCDNKEQLDQAVSGLPADDADLCVWVARSGGDVVAADAEIDDAAWPVHVQVCLRNAETDDRLGATLAEQGYEQDPDVLDTWFSSALWPFSTLGWPDPKNAAAEPGQISLGGSETTPSAFDYYYPGSCLVTARDIITLWVARMNIMGLYNHGVVPFDHCFVHAKILDGRGVTMSKSKGNGIDPVDIIKNYGTDAMRYLICDLETGMQDVRLPVQATCPSCDEMVELAEAEHGRTVFTYLCTKCGAEFDVLGTMDDVPPTTVFSNRFDAGRAFCNKLWNATRFTLMNIGELSFKPLNRADLQPEDIWILSRLNRAIEAVSRHLDGYGPSAALMTAREFFWGEFCDWYLELIKPRMSDENKAPIARQVLAAVLDQILRLLHPFVPFVTEALWEHLRQQAPTRGVLQPLEDSEWCIASAWPTVVPELDDPKLEADFSHVMSYITSFRELRSRHAISPRTELPAAIKTDGDGLRIASSFQHLIVDMANLENLTIGPDVDRPKNAGASMVGASEVFLGDVLDPEKERERLKAQLVKLNKQKEFLEKKLGNEKFVANAPEHVVEGERAKLTEVSGQIAVMEANLKSLSGNGKANGNGS